MEPRTTIPSVDLDGPGAPLVFLHANGYPPECYRPLLKLIARTHRVSAMIQRPLWPMSNPEEFTDWRMLTHDLLHFLDERYAEPVCCVGHSMGAIATLRAAIQAPEKFTAIVLIEPVLFPQQVILIWQVVRALGLGNQLHPLVTATRNRRRRFNDLEQLFDRYRSKTVFAFMDDQDLRACVRGITCRNDDGSYELCYPVSWETQIYLTSLWPDLEIWRQLPALSIPTVYIRGAQSNTFWASTARKVERKQPAARFVVLEQASHLLPMEHPVETNTLIQSFLEEIA